MFQNAPMDPKLQEVLATTWPTLNGAEQMYVELWRQETNAKGGATLSNGAFALWHKVDYDPLGVHRKPYVLDFVYVPQQHRRQGALRKLLRNCPNNLTAFAATEDGKKAMLRCGFYQHGAVLRRNKKK